MKKGPVTIWTNLTQILTVEITQCPVIWNSLTIWVPAKGLNHFFSSVFFYSRYSMSSTPSLAPLHCWCSWGVNPWCWLLQNTGLFCCDGAALSPVASWRFSSCCQVSASWHHPFSLGPLSLHIHHWPLLASHSAQPCLFFMTPSCLQNQYPLSDSHITKFSGQHEV